MELKSDKNKEIFQGVVSFINGLVPPFVKILGIKKT